MSIVDLSSRDAVLAAIAEYDRLGQAASPFRRSVHVAIVPGG
jgi:hypothetical protein